MRFGILSTANIARTAVMPAIAASDHDLVAVASRNRDRARDLADEFGIDAAYGSYDGLLADDDVDAVYNPLPNALHREWTEKAAEAGKHVLCEKPLGVDADDAAHMVDFCEDHGVTLMEAFMYRHHPRTERAVEIAAEELGEIHSVNATFTFNLGGRPDDIRLDPDLAGGSLMDVGCYAVNVARTFLGQPDSVHASTLDRRDSGVDTHVAGVLDYPHALANVTAGFDSKSVEHYRVEGEDGWLEVHDAFTPGADERAELTYEADGRRVTETFDPVDQYEREVEAFADAVDTGSAPRMSGAEAVENMAVIDALYESAERGERVDLE
ncbi:Gfo/Idh/MocA family protein [Halocalculus aciditolerans]|uniref:Oxidoreductase n=1 Tax=Halocalculus aciditolerans TaxID=1383812 RepID=A0A830FM26_9EURY|nr:Gfo/Idh/MocA family oxidoreductase [Halocalculus aciditolerans]GGL59707.1 oxidoreductase [Halocalculus aciditolerans]